MILLASKPVVVTGVVVTVVVTVAGAIGTTVTVINTFGSELVAAVIIRERWSVCVGGGAIQTCM